MHRKIYETDRNLLWIDKRVFDSNPSAGIILYMRPANERWRFIVTLTLTGGVDIQDDPGVRKVIVRNMVSKSF